ncbi:MAG: murein L,D-transpeptidase catalytic domain-containing protein [Pseudomonadota bacterium]
MKSLLVIPVVALLAVVLYVFYIYDPNPSKKETNNAVSLDQEKPQESGAPEDAASTLSEAIEFDVVPVNAPAAEDVSLAEEQVEAAVSETDDHVDPAVLEAVTASEAELAAEAESTPDSFAAESVVEADSTPDASSAQSAVEAESTMDSSTAELAVEAESTMDSSTTAAEQSMDESPGKSVVWATADGFTADTPVPGDEADAAAEEAVTPAETEESMAEANTPVDTEMVESAGSITADREESPAAAPAAEEMQPESVATAPAAEGMQPEGVAADAQQQPSGDYIKHKAVITASLYQATTDAGLSANQSARVGKILNPYLDPRRDLREGDKLTIMLDPDAAKSGNDADQVHRLEYDGAKRTLVATRSGGSLSDYEVRGADGRVLTEEASAATAGDAVQQQPEQPAEAAVSSAGSDSTAPGGMKRLQGVVTISLFSAAREAGLNAVQLKKLEEILAPYLNFNREVRKGDRIVMMMDGSEIHSSEFIGVVKKLTATRSGDGSYHVTDQTGKAAAVVSADSAATSEAQSSGSAQPDMPQKASPGDGENSENLPGESGDAGESDDQKPKKPFWKRWGIGSSSAVDDSNWQPGDSRLAAVFHKVAASGVVNRNALVRAFKYYQKNRKSTGLAQTNIAIADYTKLATSKRLHIINLNTAGVTSVQVAHGRNSGPAGGRVVSTSNANGSNQTTKGFYKVGNKEGRTSSKGYPYLHVQGLELHNRLVGLPPRKGGRDIIIHTAEYVASGGRSLGCFSIRPQDKRLVFNKLKGTLFYSYVG